MKHLGKGLAFLLLATVGVVAQETEKMAVPDYRQWVFLTSSLDLNYGTAAPPSHHMLDNIFVNPEAYGVFVKTGTWPDKTVLIKENRMAASAGTLSKAGYFQADVMDWKFTSRTRRVPATGPSLFHPMAKRPAG
jgi:hypothetical protein